MYSFLHMYPGNHLIYPDKYSDPLKPYQGYTAIPVAASRPAQTCILGNGTLPPYMKLGHAYVPYQFLGATFPPGEALHKGTVFPDLYQPYVKQGKRGCKK